MKYTTINPTLEGQLETSSGKYARIEARTTRRSTTHQIVAKHTQENSKITVYRKLGDDDIIYMAFCFKLQNKMYFPVVNRVGDTETVQIKIKALNEPNKADFDETFLFRWTETKEEWKCLNSVAEPSQYLSVTNMNQFTLSSRQKTHFRFR